jgi:hypothetical protein
LENQEIARIYKQTEQLTLIHLILALPAFGMVYIYHSSGNLRWDLPVLSGFSVWFLAGFCSMLLVAQYVLFQKKIKLSFEFVELLDKVAIYSKATVTRFWILFFVSILTAAGLLLSNNPVFTVLFALALVFFSLGKPSPDRMARLMKLKKEDRELLREASRPG